MFTKTLFFAKILAYKLMNAYKLVVYILFSGLYNNFLAVPVYFEQNNNWTQFSMTIWK